MTFRQMDPDTPVAQLIRVSTSYGKATTLGKVVYLELETNIKTPTQEHTKLEFIMTTQQAREMNEDILKAVIQAETMS